MNKMFASENMANDGKIQYQVSPPAKGSSSSNGDDEATVGTSPTISINPTNRPQSSARSPTTRKSKIFSDPLASWELSDQAPKATADVKTTLKDQSQHDPSSHRNSNESTPGSSGQARNVLGSETRKRRKFSSDDEDVENEECTNRPNFLTAERDVFAAQEAAGIVGISNVDDDARQNGPKWSLPVPPRPKDVDIMEFEKDMRGWNILSDVTERTEDDHLSDIEHDGYGGDEQSGARTIAGMMSGGNEVLGSEKYTKTKTSLYTITTEQEADLEDRVFRGGRARRRANTSYSAHTQASMARQTEKIELPPSRRNSRGNMKEPPSRMITTQRSATALGDRSRRSSIRQRRDKNGVHESALTPDLELSLNLSTSNRSVGSLDADDRPECGEQEPHMDMGWSDESPPRSASFHNRERETEEAHNGSLENGLAQLGEESCNKSGTETSTENEYKHEAKMNVAQSPRADTHHECKTQLSRAYEECDKALEQKRVLGVELAEMRRERDGAATQLEESQQKLRRAQDYDFQSLAESKEQIETLRARIGILENKIEEINKDLGNKSEDLKAANLEVEQAEKKLQRSEECTRNLHREIDELTNAINHVLQISPDKTLDVDALKSLTQSSDFNSETNSLHSSILQLTHCFESSMKSLSLNSAGIQQQLADKEHELALAVSALRADTKAANSSSQGEMQPWEVDHDRFEQLYKREKRLRESAEEAGQKFKETANKLYQPDLERINRELQIDLTQARDESATLHERVKKHQGLAQAWESEFKNSKFELEKRRDEFQDEFKAQRTEMLLYIKEYHDKTKDPEHWELSGLQKRIRALERDLQITNELFGTTKSEKAKLEDEVIKLMNTNTRYEKDIERLGKAWIIGGVAPPLSAIDSDRFDSSSDHSSAPSSIPWLTSPKKPPPHFRQVPRCHLPEEIKKREVIITAFKDEQKKRQEEGSREAAIMEKVRKWRMSELYPPAKEKEWKKLIGDSSWGMWDGEVWFKHAASSEEKEIVKASGKKGMFVF